MAEFFANYHTHTTYCDGNSTPDEIVREAVSLGMKELGFSGHSYTSIDESYCMSKEGTKKYFDEISGLREQYAGKIRILLGLERDYFADPDEYSWDFVIGSCHYIEKNGEIFSVDESQEILLDACDRLYGGDIYSLIEDYYSEVGKVFEKTGCDIIGHFDLITKFNEDGKIFDEENPRYAAAWMFALDEIFKSAKESGRSPLFEINTGAMSRGYRTSPYPSGEILKELSKRGAAVILSSDSHDKSTLLYGFSDAAKAALDAGLTPLPVLSACLRQA